MERNDWSVGWNGDKQNRKGYFTNKYVPYKNKKQYPEIFDELSPLFYKHLRLPENYYHTQHQQEPLSPHKADSLNIRSYIGECFNEVFGDDVRCRIVARDKESIYKRFLLKSGKFEVDEILRIFSDRKGTEFQTTMDKLTAWFVAN